ncbi:hypothetical protein HZ994_18090 [Akkermansiaceae bacterium]|nr:hypothetical protein HZ994_18090 [Akkermansiaceae bacterium]
MNTAPLLNQKSFVWVAVGFLAAALVIICLSTGTNLTEPRAVARKLPLAVTAELAGWFVFRKWLWRWKFLNPWLVIAPDLNGDWEGSVTPVVNGGNGESPEAIPVRMTIRQTLTTFSCVVQTKEMTSRSFSAGFQIEPDSQRRQLTYSYESLPRAGVRDHSPVHFGTTRLEIDSEDPTEMTGEYWTNRRTKGELTFSRISASAKDQIDSTEQPPCKS